MLLGGGLSWPAAVLLGLLTGTWGPDLCRAGPGLRPEPEPGGARAPAGGGQARGAGRARPGAGRPAVRPPRRARARARERARAARPDSAAGLLFELALRVAVLLLEPLALLGARRSPPGGRAAPCPPSAPPSRRSRTAPRAGPRPSAWPPPGASRYVTTTRSATVGHAVHLGQVVLVGAAQVRVLGVGDDVRRLVDVIRHRVDGGPRVLDVGRVHGDHEVGVAGGELPDLGGDVGGQLLVAVGGLAERLVGRALASRSRTARTRAPCRAMRSRRPSMARARQDSNLRPLAPEASALSTELRAPGRGSLAPHEPGTGT